MDINTVGQLVGSIGFPIVSFFMMFWLFKDNMSKLTETVENNTKALVELNEIIRKEMKDND